MLCHHFANQRHPNFSKNKEFGTKNSAVELIVRKNDDPTEVAVDAGKYVTPYGDLHPILVSSIGMVYDGGGLGGRNRAVIDTHACKDSSILVDVDEYVACKPREHLRAQEVDPRVRGCEDARQVVVGVANVEVDCVKGNRCIGHQIHIHPCKKRHLVL